MKRAFLRTCLGKAPLHAAAALMMAPAIAMAGEAGLAPATVGDWTPACEGLTARDGVFSLDDKKLFLMSAGKLAISPEKTHTLSGKFRKNTYGVFSCFFFGVAPLDAEGKHITPQMVTPVEGTLTKLTEPARKGDRTIKVRDASRWRAGPSGFAAFGAREDLGDLPNADCSGKVEGIKDMTTHWEILLGTPLEKDHAEGTGVREHSSGANFIYCEPGASPFLPENLCKASFEWETFSLRIKGVSRDGADGRKWRPGARFAKIIVHGHDGRPLDIQFKDIRLAESDDDGGGKGGPEPCD